MCLSWGFLIPLGVVIACFRTVRGMGTWWFHLHRALQILGFLVSLAGLAVGVYLDPGQGGLFWQHKIIGVTVNVLALVQVRHMLSFAQRLDCLCLSLVQGVSLASNALKVVSRKYSRFSIVQFHVANDN